MKNIWKFLMVAMMAIAMVGCPQPQNNPTDNGGENGGSAEGVYSFTITADMMGAFDEAHAWGSEEGAFRTIKFILVPNDVEFEGEASFTDSNKIYVYAHNDIDNGRIYFNQFGDGALQVVSKVGADYYKAAAVKKSGDDYIVYFDMNKVALASLYAKGAKESKRGEDTWSAFNTLVSNYTPYIIGNVTSNVWDEEKNPEGYEDFEVVMWNAGVVKMEKSSTPFPVVKVPTGIDYDTLPDPNAPKDPVNVDWFTDTFYLRGTFNGWSGTACALNNGVITFTYDSTSDLGAEFAFTNDGWTYKICGFEITALNTEITVQGNESVGAENASIAENILKKGTTYSFVIERVTGDTSFKIKLVEGSTATSSSDWTPPADDSSTPAGGNDDSSTPAGGNDDSSTPAGGNDDSSTPAGGNDDSSTPAGGNDDSSTPAGGNDDSSTPAGGNDDSSTPAGGNDDSSEG